MSALDDAAPETDVIVLPAVGADGTGALSLRSASPM